MIAVGYLVGGIPIGVLVARARGVDLMQVGSGNIGASNVQRTLGTGLGIAVWLADLLKGLVPVVWAERLLRDMPDPWPYIAAVGVAAVLGHCLAVYLRLRGGKGVSTTLGVILALDWRVGLIAFAIWLFVLGLTRFISVSSMVATALTPLLFLVMPPLPSHSANARGPLVAAGIALALVVVLRHIPNIRKLIKGTESRVGEKAEVPRPEGIEGGPESETEYR
jgi:glycerol-3-phosphate acyltransferase PlsY